MARRKDRPAGPLDIRAQAILQTIIEEYVATALPVGSQVLVSRHALGVSSATVRNIMAELEQAGYLTHPHTSAGRVPTNLGYRFYVQTVVTGQPLMPADQLTIRHQFGQIEETSDEWIRLAAATVASMTREAGLATAARPSRARLRRVDLVASGEHSAAIVLVLAEGPVKQALISLDEPVDQEDLDAIARQMNALLGGATTLDVARRLARLPDATLPGATPAQRLAGRVGQRVQRVMQEFDTTPVEEVFSEGILNVLEAPEFAQSEKLRRIFGLLQDRSYLGRLVSDVSRRGDVQVYIGSENQATEMQEVSLVLAPYGQPGRAQGVVGALGPTRMAYPQVIGTVRYVSGLMNELLGQLYT